MAKTNPETILLVGDRQMCRKQRDANAAILPGDLVELMSTNKVRRHATANGPAAKLFAVENDIAGDGITDAYAANEAGQIHAARPGDEIYANLANGQSVVIGDYLVSDGAGRLQKQEGDSSAFDAGRDTHVAMALEAKDLSDSSAADPTFRTKVMVI